MFETRALLHQITRESFLPEANLTKVLPTNNPSILRNSAQIEIHR